LNIFRNFLKIKYLLIIRLFCLQLQYATAIHEHHIPDVCDATATEEDDIRGADPGGAGGAAAPPILILVVQTYHFAPPIIPVHK